MKYFVLPVGVVAATVVKGTAGIGTEVVEDVEEEDVGMAEKDDGKVDVAGCVVKKDGVNEEDVETTRLNRKPETTDDVVVAVVVGAVVSANDGANVGAVADDEMATVEVDDGANDGAVADDELATVEVDDGANDRADNVTNEGADDKAGVVDVMGAAPVVVEATDEEAGTADTDTTSRPWLAGTRP